MAKYQSGILEPVPQSCRYLEFVALPDADLAEAIHALAALPLLRTVVVGFGAGLAKGLGRAIPGHRGFPSISGHGVEIPSTQADIWCRVHGKDQGDIVLKTREIEQTLREGFRLERLVDGFKFGEGRDLTGYIDGTENPEAEAARDAAIVGDDNKALAGSSFVAVQQWDHDLEHFKDMEQEDQDHIIGRRLSDNEELDDAPPSAHVKRTAQESFTPEAFVVRRSMPWADATGEGLMFVAYGKSLDAFEAQLKRMAGLDDGIVDGLFRFSRPTTGSFFWCPPLRDGRLDLRPLGL